MKWADFAARDILEGYKLSAENLESTRNKRRTEYMTVNVPRAKLSRTAGLGVPRSIPLPVLIGVALVVAVAASLGIASTK